MIRRFKRRSRKREESLSEQVEHARQALRRTRIRCSITVLLVLAYASLATVSIRSRFLQPKSAAALASQYVSNVFAVGSGTGSEASVESTPSLAARFFTMPFSNSVGNSEPPADVSTESVQVLQSAMTAHGKALLASDPANIRKMMQVAQKPRTVEELGSALDAEIRQHLPSKDRRGLPDQAYLNYLCQTLALMSQLEWQLDRLAHGNDLTSYEKTLRRVVAVTMGGGTRKLS